MNNARQDNDVIKEIVEKHFENMVDDVLAHTETYYEALGAVSCIKGSKIPNMIQLADCLGKAIRKRAMQQKTPNHNQVLEERYIMNELVWFYFTIIINIFIGFATYYASKRDRNKRIDEYKKRQETEIERVRKKFNL